ncbi:FecR family protein [Bacteroides sp. 51]|uniref:FecR family protein n=1 Tax=Bacteroides sp. 51 TaxID=2302938 RepID=UPI0013D09CBD|nr:FecR domain-containing protein [Bacteroides sp. 51]NDV80694.1 FecR family protein [Bacteroides sp. 51]
MNERIQQYFQGTLNSTERLELLKEIEMDDSLKEQFIQFQNLYALMHISPQAENRLEGEKGYSRFINRRKKHLWSKRMKSVMKYAAVIALAIFSTYWITDYLSVQEPLLAETNTLYVPAGQRAQITLQDGTTVWLNAQSTMTYPSHFMGDERRVSISGEAYFNVARNERNPFIVSASDIEMKVLGTEFNVYCYPDAEVIQTSLISGSVKVSKLNQPHSGVILKPNEQITIKGNQMQVNTIKQQDAFLWKEGIYSFEDERLEQIMKKLELYYDVTIVIKNESLKNRKYTCKFRQRDSIDEILEIICRIHRFKVVRDREKNIITIS